MSTIKINELATSSISLSDYFAKADVNGLATKNTIQGLANILDVASSSQFKGSLAIADTPTLDGWYFASESGTYTNAGSLVVDISDNIVIIIVSDTQTTFSKVDIPVTLTIDATPTSGSTNAVQSGGTATKINVDSKLQTLEIFKDSVLYDYNDIEWVTGKYLNALGVEDTSGVNSYSKNYLPVEPEKAYSFKFGDIGCSFYDESKVFISSFIAGDSTNKIRRIETPLNCRFIRVNQSNSYLLEFKFKIEYTYKISNLSILGKVENQIENFENNTIIFPDNVVWVDGKYLNALGVEYSFTSLSYSENYFEINPLRTYRMPSIGIAIIWYDEDFGFISSSGDLADNYSERVFTPPINAKYIRFNQSTVNIPSFFVKIENTYQFSKLRLPNTSIINLKQEVGINESVNGFYNVTSSGAFVSNANYKSTKFEIDPTATYYATGKIFGSGNALAVYYNSSGTYISAEFIGNNVSAIEYVDQLLTIPVNAKFIGMTNNSTTEYSILKPNYYIQFDDFQQVDSLDDLSFNVWKDKKIAWYGTSIPAGFPETSNQNVYSYANKSAIKLGATIQNYAVPNGIIRKFKSTGLPTDRADTLSFTNTLGTSNYLDDMVNLIGTSDEPDLFVFDYSVNDYEEDPTDIDAGLWDLTSESLSTFHGSMNFVIKQLLTAKPKARIALFTHFSNDKGNSLAKWGKTNEVIEAVGNYWGIPVCKVYEKSGLVNKNGISTISLYIPDHIHPATDTTGQTVELLTKISLEFLKGIS